MLPFADWDQRPTERERKLGKDLPGLSRFPWAAPRFLPCTGLGRAGAPVAEQPDHGSPVAAAASPHTCHRHSGQKSRIKLLEVMLLAVSKPPGSQSACRPFSASSLYTCATSLRAPFLTYQTPTRAPCPSGSVSFFPDKISISIRPSPILRTPRMVFFSNSGQFPHASILTHVCKGPLACRGVILTGSGEQGAYTLRSVT